MTRAESIDAMRHDLLQGRCLASILRSALRTAEKHGISLQSTEYQRSRSLLISDLLTEAFGLSLAEAKPAIAWSPCNSRVTDAWLNERVLPAIVHHSTAWIKGREGDAWISRIKTPYPEMRRAEDRPRFLSPEGGRALSDSDRMDVKCDAKWGSSRGVQSRGAS